MPYRDARIFSPEVCYGNTAAIIAVVHAHKIPGIKAGIHLRDPVPAVLVGASLEAPESGMAGRGDHFVMVVHPFFYFHRLPAVINIGHFNISAVGKLCIGFYGQYFFQPVTAAVPVVAPDNAFSRFVPEKQRFLFAENKIFRFIIFCFQVFGKRKGRHQWPAAGMQVGDLRLQVFIDGYFQVFIPDAAHLGKAGRGH